MSEKIIHLPASFDVDQYIAHRVQNADAASERVQNEFGSFAGIGVPLGGGQNGVNPFGFPQDVNFPGTQTLSQAGTVFNNLRWYFVSNFRQMLSEAYVELGLIQAVVDLPVDDAFRGGVEIKTKQLSPEQVEQLQISLDRDDDLNTIATTAKWNRLFGGAGTLILTDQDPRTPLDISAIREDSPLEFRAVDLWELFWDKQNTEGYDPQLQAQEFEFYNYYGEVIHKSRVLRMKGLTAPSFVRPRLRGWGFSVVEILVRSINQYLKSTDLAFELLDEWKIDVYRLKNLVNTLLSPQGANKVRQRVAVANQIKNYQNAIVMDSEDSYEQRTMSWTGFADVMKEIRVQVASDVRMPLTKLFGISAAGFNSGEDDIEVYNSMVESQVRNKVKYQILRVLEVKCQKMFGMIPSDLTVTFKPLRELSATDQETVKSSKFMRLSQAQQAGQITMEQFIDAVNKGQLLDVLLDKEDMLNPPQDDTVRESDFLDPRDPKSVNDPGTNRHDTRYPMAFEYEGVPKGLKKEDYRTEKPWPEAGDSKAARDEAKQPGSNHPFGVSSDPDDLDTHPDEDEFSAPQRRPLEYGDQPERAGDEAQTDDETDEQEAGEPSGEQEDPDWLDEKTPEQEEKEHALRLEPKKAKRPLDAAPEAKVAKSGKPARDTSRQHKTSPPEPPGHPEKRRVNNESYERSKLEQYDKGVQAKRIVRGGNVYTVPKGTKAAIDARTSGNQPGVILPGTYGGDRKTPLRNKRKRKNSGTEQLGNQLALFGFEDADLVQNPGNFFRTPDDRSVDIRSRDNATKQDPRKTRYAVCVAVFSGKKGNRSILTGRRRDSNMWVLPGGKVELGEEWIVAAARELAEETGIQVPLQRLQQVTQQEYVHPDHKTVVRLYALELPDKTKARVNDDPDMEVDVWRWVPFSRSTLELKSWNRHHSPDILQEMFKSTDHKKARK